MPTPVIPLAVDPENETLTSALNNFILNFYGAIAKTVVDGQVVWVLPCDLSQGIPGYPRDPALGTACYFKSLFETFGAQITDAEADALAAQAAAANAVATAEAAQLTADAAQGLATNALSLIAALGDMSAQDSDAVNISGGIIDGPTVRVSAPLTADDAVPKIYVDSLSGGIVPKPPATVATTSDITLSGEQTIDGVLTSASRVLVKNQTLSENNGIYVTGAGAWTRAADANTAGELLVNQYYFVSSGTVNSGTGWFISTAPTVLGTDPIVFSQFSASSTYSAGAGLQLTGTQFSVSPPLDETLGGTGNTAYVAGDILVAANTTTLSRLTAGAANSVLAMVGAAPGWASSLSLASLQATNIGNVTPGAAVFTTASATTFTGALSGNASTAAALQTARNINGVAFNGTGDITVGAAANTLTGTTLASNVVNSSLQTYAGGAFAGMALQAPGSVNISGGTVSGTNLSGSSATSTGSSTSRTLASRFAETLNALDYGADNTGASDNTAAFTALVTAALANDGTVPELLLNRYIGGFSTPPSNTWTGRPSLTLTGGLNGATGFQAYGNINPGGYLASIEITNRGTGYNILTYVCNRTNGSPTITLSSGSFDARIVAGTSVRFESIQATCTVLTRNSNVSLTLTESMTFTNADQFVFGFPLVNVNGTPAPLDIVPLVGKHRTVVFPPGDYKLTGGFPSLGGLSNVHFVATGASFQFTSNTGTGFGIRNASGIRWTGGDFYYQGSRFSTPTTRTRYSGQGFAVASSQWVTVENVATWDAFEFGFLVGGDLTAGTYWAERVKLVNCRSNNPLGDGFHVTGGSRWVRIVNCDTIQPGDDAFAVVNDADVAARNPTDIEYNTCRVDGGLYRGCVALGSDYVRFINITGRDTHGPFCWASPDGVFDAPSWVTFENIVADNIGNTAVSNFDTNSGIGITASNVAGLRIRNCSFKQDATVFGSNVVFNIDEATVTFGDWPGRKIQTISGTGTLPGSLNTDLVCSAGNGFAAVVLEGPHRYKVSGTITARSSTGAFGQLWAVFWDAGTSTEYGGGSALQWNNTGERYPLPAEAIIDVQGSSQTIIFKVKQGGGGTTIDAGTSTGPNSVITAIQID